MSEADEALEWVEYAEEDLIIAKSALRRSKPLTIGSCFHSQQCAEKYLKAILVSQNVEFPKTHDLLILNTLCTTAGILQALPRRTWAGCRDMQFTPAIQEINPLPKKRRIRSKLQTFANLRGHFWD